MKHRSIYSLYGLSSLTDGFNSIGVYSRDKLTVAPGVALEGFHFGCSHGRGDKDDMSIDLIGLGN